MRKINKVIILVLILVTLFNIRVYAHGGNITGWNKKDSTEITEYNRMDYRKNYKSDYAWAEIDNIM